MRKRLISFWNNYKFRFVPWLALNLKQKYPQDKTIKPSLNANKVCKNRENESYKDNNNTNQTPNLNSSTNPQINNPIVVHHIQKGDDVLLSDVQLLSILIDLFSSYLQSSNKDLLSDPEQVHKQNLDIMRSRLGYTIERRKSLISDDAGTGVFLTSGIAKRGSLIALYPGSIYQPSEPLFFPSIGNPFIFRCSDGVHIDGNDKWISKSIFKSCAARDKFRTDLPCCDESWLTATPFNSLNIGQYVNNRSKSAENNVIYQESSVVIGLDPGENTLPVHLCQYLPNVWANPSNNHVPIRIIPLVATKEISEGEEILSSYFTVVHAKN